MTDYQFDQFMGLLGMLIATQFYNKSQFLTMLWTFYGLFMFIFALIDVCKLH